MGRRKLGQVIVNVGGPPKKTKEKVAASVEGIDPRPGINRAWANVEMMTVNAAVAAVWTVKSIDMINIARQKSGYANGIPLGAIRPTDCNPEDTEQFILRNWGPGVYILSPMYRGMALRHRQFIVGGDAALRSADPVGVNIASDELAGVDKEISDSLKRESALQSLERMRKLRKESEEDDDVKAADLERILDKINTRPPAPEGPSQMERLLEKQMSFLEKQLDLERQRNDRLTEQNTKTSTTDPNTLIGLGSVLIPLIGKLPAKSLSGILGSVMRFLRPEQPEPETGWTPDQVMNAVQMAGPMIQGLLMPILEQVRNIFRPGAAPNPAEAARNVTPPPVFQTMPTTAPNGGPDMPVKLNEEEKYAMDLFFQYLNQKDYESAWGALGSTDETSRLCLGLIEVSDKAAPQSILPAFMRLDVRAKGMAGEIYPFIEWVRTVKKPEVLARAAEQAEEEEE